MARYFFDVIDNGRILRDTDGLECAGHDGIRSEAMHTLPAIARDTIPKDGDRQALTVMVRNENGVTVYTTTLTFAGLWMGDDIPPASDQ